MTEENQIKVLQWADKEIPGGFVPWQPFTHPQLGDVEIGGWNFKWTHQNPPGPFMEKLEHGNAMFTLRCATSNPHVHLTQVTTETVAPGVYKVRAVVENGGFLPTQVSEQAKAMGKAKPVTVELTGEGMTMLSGKAKQTLGDLAGRNDQYEPLSYMPPYANEARKAADWVVQAPAGTTLTVTSIARNGGTDTKTVTLP